MTDVTLSSIKGGGGGGIRSRDLSGAVVTSVASVLNVESIFSAGVTSANVFKEVINISGKGWLLSCAVRNADSNSSVTSGGFISGKLIIDGIETVATLPFSTNGFAAGIMFLGGAYTSNIPQPSATPVRFEQGFSLEVADSVSRSSGPFIGWHLLYLLD